MKRHIHSDAILLIHKYTQDVLPYTNVNNIPKDIIHKRTRKIRLITVYTPSFCTNGVNITVHIHGNTNDNETTKP